MPGTVAKLSKGTRITDCTSLGVLTTTFSLHRVKAVLVAQDNTGQRQRELPVHVVVCYVICLALFSQVFLSRGVARCGGVYGGLIFQLVRRSRWRRPLRLAWPLRHVFLKPTLGNKAEAKPGALYHGYQ